jgi:class 3 adenylate cyclase
MSGLPGGSVTFVFTDTEGSTRLVKALRDGYAKVLAEHRRLVRAAIAAHGGHEVDTQGDAFFAAFAGARQAVLCALEVQRGLAAHAWPGGAVVRVRIGVHTGHAVPAGGGYTGLGVHRAARICAAAAGGQVLVSQATQALVEDEEEELGFTLVDVGERRLRTWTGRCGCSSWPRPAWMPRCWRRPGWQAAGRRAARRLAVCMVSRPR